MSSFFCNCNNLFVIMGKRHQILVVWGHFTQVKSLLSDFSLHWIQNWFNRKVKYSKWIEFSAFRSLNSPILFPLFWRMLLLFWPHYHPRGHPSHVTIVGPGNGPGSWSELCDQAIMRPGPLWHGQDTRHSPAPVTGLHVTRDRVLWQVWPLTRS